MLVGQAAHDVQSEQQPQWQHSKAGMPHTDSALMFGVQQAPPGGAWSRAASSASDCACWAVSRVLHTCTATLKLSDHVLSLSPASLQGSALPLACSACTPAWCARRSSARPSQPSAEAASKPRSSEQSASRHQGPALGCSGWQAATLDPAHVTLHDGCGTPGGSWVIPPDPSVVLNHSQVG